MGGGEKPTAMTLNGSCHCGAVRFGVPRAPDSVNSCNCSVCRRYGTLWGYYRPDEVTFDGTATATDTYSWGERDLDFHRCRTCGCVTHWAMRVPDPDDDRMAINARLLDPSAIADVPVRFGDGASA